MSKTSLLPKPSQTSARAPLLATVSKRGDVARLSLKTTEGKVLRLTLGPRYHARLIRIDSKTEAREFAVSTARSACAIVTTDLKVTDGRAVCNLTTRYGTRTVRKDATSLEKDHVRRVVHWDHGNGVSAEARYSEWERVLQFRDNSNELARYVTRGEPTENGWRSSTEYIGAPAGSESYDFGRAGNFGPGLTQGFVVNTGGEPIIHMVSRSADGKNTVTYEHTAVEPPDQEDGSPRTVAITSYTQFDGTTGTLTGVNQITNTWESGAISVTTVIETSDIFAGTHAKTLGVAEAGGDGVVKTRTSWTDGSNSQTTDWSNDGDGHETELTTTTHSDGSSERSSTAKDGRGNESNTIVSYNADGSFSISTTSKGSDGSETTNTQDYDKDGNPKPAGDGGGSGGGGGGSDDGGGDSGGGDSGGGEEGLPADDGSGGGTPSPKTMGAGGDGELPADDGSDPAPRPNMTGPGAAALQRWMASASPFLGGSSAAPLATHGNPASQIVAAMDDEGDGVGTGEPSNGDGEFRIDLRAIVLRERDPENNPRALVAALQQLAGVPQGGAAMRAAEHLLGQLGA
jgi:hypothetical protein